MNCAKSGVILSPPVLVATADAKACKRRLRVTQPEARSGRA